MTYLTNPNRTMSEPGKALHENLKFRFRNPYQKEYSRLLTAAVINSRFRDLLLTDAEKALAEGYGEEIFHFPPEEARRVMSIRAVSLADFAQQLIEHQSPVHHLVDCPSD